MGLEREVVGGSKRVGDGLSRECVFGAVCWRRVALIELLAHRCDESVAVPQCTATSTPALPAAVMFLALWTEYHDRHEREYLDAMTKAVTITHYVLMNHITGKHHPRLSTMSRAAHS